MKKISAITVSMAFVILTAMNGAAQEQKDPFKKEQADKTENAAKPQQSQATPLVSIEMRMIEMSRLAADEVFKEQGGIAKTFIINEKTLNTINDMVIKNKAKVVSQSKIITDSRSCGENKSVRELIYPTEYCSTPIESNGTNSVTAQSGNILIFPSAFETRDCGTMFTVTPIVGPDNKLIDIAMVLQRVRLSAGPNKVIVNSPTGETEVSQPLFLSESMTISLMIPTGSTVLASVCDAIDDQEKPEKTGENIILLIMTACVVPVN